MDITRIILYKEYMEIDLKHYKKLLLDKQQELESLLVSVKESTKPVELDQQSVGRLSRMDAMQVQAMALENERRRKEEVKMIAAALARIETEDYGYCLQCDEPIAPKRLELNPTVPTCIKCASGKG